MVVLCANCLNCSLEVKFGCLLIFIIVEEFLFLMLWFDLNVCETNYVSHIVVI